MKSLLLFTLIFISIFSTVSAEQKSITSIGEYSAESFENISTAKEHALNEAIKLASLQAGVYVKNISESQDKIITNDTIEMISANILEIQNEVYETIDADNMKIVRCKLTVVIDDKNINEAIFRDKSENIQAITRSKKYEETNDLLQYNLKQLKDQLKNAKTDSNYQQILDEIIINEQKFSANEHFSAGNKFMYRKKYVEAFEEFNKAIELNPTHAYAYNNRGIMFFGKGYLTDAMNDFTKSIELNPTAEAYNNRGNIYYYEKKYNQAVEEYSHAIHLDSNYIEAYTNRGLAYNELKKFDKAIVDLTKAIELNPTAETYVNRGDAYFTQKNYNWAILDYTKAIEIDPNYSRAYNNRGYTYQKQSQFEKALDDYGTALKLDPNNKKAQENFDRLQKLINKYLTEES